MNKVKEGVAVSKPVPTAERPLYSHKAKNIVCGTGMTITALLAASIFITHETGPLEAYYASISWTIFIAFVTFLAWCIFTIVELEELHDKISSSVKTGIIDRNENELKDIS